MSTGWHEKQRAFQARVITEAGERLGLRPYRTFIGSPVGDRRRSAGRMERFVVVVVTGAVIVGLLLGLGVARELAALVASFTGGVGLVIAVAPEPRPRRADGWAPLLAIYPPTVKGGSRPVCVTEIGLEELDRLGIEGFGTVVGEPRPGATFGLFVDDHLVWPRTPPRGAEAQDPGFGTS